VVRSGPGESITGRLGRRQVIPGAAGVTVRTRGRSYSRSSTLVHSRRRLSRPPAVELQRVASLTSSVPENTPGRDCSSALNASRPSAVKGCGGAAALILAACYWWIDVRDHRRRLEFFTIIGMNSIFIYLFFEIVGDRWFTAYAGAVTNGVMQMAHIPVTVMEIVTSLCVFMLEWGLCYFLYKKKIFFRV